jgi:hypothetical protein
MGPGRDVLLAILMHAKNDVFPARGNFRARAV